MKVIEKFKFKTFLLRNWSVLAIFSNILSFFLSIYYFEHNTVFSTLFVTGLFISWHLLSITKSIKNKTVTFHSYFLDLELPSYFVAICFIVFSIVKSLVFIKIVSVFQEVFLNSWDGSLFDIPINFWTGVLIIGLFAVYAFFSIFKLADGKQTTPVVVQIDYFKEKYNLDLHKTYFCLINNTIVSFVIGKYTFDVVGGLIVGKRKYRPSIILDYFKIMEIGFHDLDDGHVKNIEMYGISN